MRQTKFVILIIINIIANEYTNQLAFLPTHNKKDVYKQHFSLQQCVKKIRLCNFSLLKKKYEERVNFFIVGWEDTVRNLQSKYFRIVVVAVVFCSLQQLEMG